MHEFNETHYLSLKRGERKNDKKNYIGIAMCCNIADVVV